MKMIYPVELKVQAAHSFHSAPGIKQIKRQLLTSTAMFLFRLCEYERIKAPLQTAVKKNTIFS